MGFIILIYFKYDSNPFAFFLLLNAILIKLSLYVAIIPLLFALNLLELLKFDKIFSMSSLLIAL